jgi:hypothetical protein
VKNRTAKCVRGTIFRWQAKNSAKDWLQIKRNTQKRTPNFWSGKDMMIDIIRFTRAC